MREMKDSGIEWIGKIPEDWKVSKIKKEYRFQTGWTPDTKIDSNFNGDNIWVNISDMKEPIIYDSVKHISDEAVNNSSMSISPKGSLLYAFKLSVGAVSFCGRDLYTNEAIATFLPDDNKNLRFLYYMAPLFIIKNANENIYGAKLLNQQLIQNATIVMPPTDVQNRIVEYLDSKCTQIDSIISKQEAIIKKLKEYKLSVITEAVTKGLNPNVEMKDSGDLRIAYIPITWDKVKITRLLDYTNLYPIGDGDHGLIKTENYKDEGVPYIRVQNLGWGTELILDNVIYISEEDNERIKNSELHPNDILFCKTGATIGKTGIVPKDLPRANTTSHVGKITIDDKYNSRFVFYYLSSEVGYEQFWDIACMKSTRPELSIEETKAINICIPRDRKEQDEIVEYLDLIIPEIDLRIRKAEAISEKISEYKKSLIYEVVTGKKEV